MRERHKSNSQLTMTDSLGITGIPAAEGMQQQFVEFRSGNPAFCVFQIRDHALQLVYSQSVSQGNGNASFEDNTLLLREYLSSNAKTEDAAYLLIHNGESSSGFLMVTYIPDGCSGRDKMVYSGTASNLRSLLGSSITRTLQRCDFDSLTTEDMLDSGVPTHLMTERERQLKEESKATADIIASTNPELSVGSSAIAFSLSTGVESVLQELASQTRVLEPLNNVVTLWLDESENLQTESLKSAGPEELPSLFPTDKAVFFVVRYVHSFEGYTKAPTLFVMASPESLGPRQKMIASSAKRSVATTVSKYLTITEEMQANCPEDLGVESIFSRLHPPNRLREASKVQTSLVGSRVRPKGRGSAPALKPSAPPPPPAP